MQDIRREKLACADANAVQYRNQTIPFLCEMVTETVRIDFGGSRSTSTEKTEGEQTNSDKTKREREGGEKIYNKTVK